MKIHLVQATALLAALQASNTLAWAPAISSLATRTTVPTRFSSSTRRFVASDIEEQKGAAAEEDKTSAAFLEDVKPKILGEPIPYKDLTIGVLKETFKGENRVSQTPDSVRSLVKAGFTVIVQPGGT